MPSWACSFHFVSVNSKGSCFLVVELDVKIRIVFKWHACIWIKSSCPSQFIDVLSALDKFSCFSVDRVKETIAGKVSGNFSDLSVN